jgi:hypothetical protein
MAVGGQRSNLRPSSAVKNFLAYTLRPQKLPATTLVVAEGATR